MPGSRRCPGSSRVQVGTRYFALPLEIIFVGVSEPSGCFLASTKTLCPGVSLSAVGVRAVTVTLGGRVMVSPPPPYSIDRVDSPDLVLTVPLVMRDLGVPPLAAPKPDTVPLVILLRFASFV